MITPVQQNNFYVARMLVAKHAKRASKKTAAGDTSSSDNTTEEMARKVITHLMESPDKSGRLLSVGDAHGMTQLLLLMTMSSMTMMTAPMMGTQVLPHSWTRLKRNSRHQKWKQK